MKNALLITVWICCINSIPGFAQKQNSSWVFYNKLSIHFTDTPVIGYVPVTGYFQYLNIPSAVCDENGSLLFYGDGRSIYNNNHLPMNNGSGLDSVAGSSPYELPVAAAAAICPIPNSSSRYAYINTPLFYLYDTEAANVSLYSRLRYSIVDMSLDGGNGDVLTNKKNITIAPKVDFTGLAATGNGICEKWVVAKEFYSNRILSFKVTDTGITTNPVVSLHNSINDMAAAWYKFSPDNHKLAAYYYHYPNFGTPAWDSLLPPAGIKHYCVLYDFNTTTGVVSNPIIIDSMKASDSLYDYKWRFGGAFSPNSSKFYLIRPTDSCYQYDLSQASVSAIIQSKKSVISLTDDGGLLSNPQLAPDNKIYYLADTYLSANRSVFWVIQHPDAIAAYCAPVKKIIHNVSLKEKALLISFQNDVPTSGYSNSYNHFNTCAFPATLSSLQNSADSYIWSTGATTSSVTVNQNGTYWVKALQACGAYRVDTFHVHFNPPIPLADTFSCNGSPIQLHIDPDAAYTWHNNSQGSLITQSGIYHVTISKGECGILEDSFSVTIYPPLSTPVLPKDTLVCSGSAAFTIKPLYAMKNALYKWNTGDTDGNIVVTQPGKYSVQITTPCGIYSDTVTVNFCKPNISSISFADSFCANSCTSFTAVVSNFPESYHWSFPGSETPEFSGAVPATICYVQPGVYTVRLIVGNAGGMDTMSRMVTVLPRPQGRFTDTAITLSYNYSILLYPCTDAARTDWYRDDTLICRKCAVLEPDNKLWRSNYHCVVQNGDCSDTCFYHLTVTDIPPGAWLPNAFTPNGDGLNDRFAIVSENPNIHILNLSVYNRYGERVYTAYQDRRGWDGTFHGIPANSGVYYWYLEYNVYGRHDNLVFKQKGDVTLVR